MNLYSRCPTLDLHGFDRDYARIMINDFIRDCYIMKEKRVIIIHGVGSGILRKTTQQVLKHNNYVLDDNKNIWSEPQLISIVK